jgi:hypothetical protein
MIPIHPLPKQGRIAGQPIAPASLSVTILDHSPGNPDCSVFAFAGNPKLSDQIAIPVLHAKVE